MEGCIIFSIDEFIHAHWPKTKDNEPENAYTVFESIFGKDLHDKLVKHFSGKEYCLTGDVNKNWYFTDVPAELDCTIRKRFAEINPNYVRISDPVKSKVKVTIIYNWDKGKIVGVYSSYIGALKWGLKYLVSGECGDLALEDFNIEGSFEDIDWSDENIQQAVDDGMADEYMKVEEHIVQK